MQLTNISIHSALVIRGLLICKFTCSHWQKWSKGQFSIKNGPIICEFNICAGSKCIYVNNEGNLYFKLGFSSSNIEGIDIFIDITSEPFIQNPNLVRQKQTCFCLYGNVKVVLKVLLLPKIVDVNYTTDVITFLSLKT
jgi:hypothetical protein